jgi:hypothetical protein
MARNLTLVLAAVLIAAAGFGLGMSVRGALVSRAGAGDTRSEVPRKDFDELVKAWKYPGARSYQSAVGGAVVLQHFHDGR